MAEKIYTYAEITQIGNNIQYLYQQNREQTREEYSIYMHPEQIECIYHKPWHSSMYLKNSKKEIKLSLNNFDEVSLDYYIKNEFKNYYPYLVIKRDIPKIDLDKIHKQTFHNIVFDKELLDKFCNYWDTQDYYDFYETIKKYIYGEIQNCEVNFMIEKKLAKILEFGDYKILFIPDTEKMLFNYDSIINTHIKEPDQNKLLEEKIKEFYVNSKKQTFENTISNLEDNLRILFDRFYNKTRNVRLKYLIFLFHKNKSENIRHQFELIPEHKSLLEFIIAEFKKFIGEHDYFKNYIDVNQIVFYNQFPSEHLKNVFYIMTEYLYPFEELKQFSYKQDMIHNLYDIIENLGKNIPFSGIMRNPDDREIQIYKEYIFSYFDKFNINKNNLLQEKILINTKWKNNEYDLETKKIIVAKILKYIDYLLHFDEIKPIIKKPPFCGNNNRIICNKIINIIKIDEELTKMGNNMFNIYNMCLRTPQCIFLDEPIIKEEYRNIYREIKRGNFENRDILINFKLNPNAIRRIITELKIRGDTLEKKLITKINNIRNDFLIYVAYLCYKKKNSENLKNWINWLILIYCDTKIIFMSDSPLKTHFAICYFEDNPNKLYQLKFTPKLMNCSLMTNAYFMKYTKIMESENYTYYRGFNVSDYENYFGYKLEIKELGEEIENIIEKENNITLFRGIFINDFNDKITKYSGYIGDMFNNYPNKFTEIYDFYIKFLYGNNRLVESIIEISNTKEEFIEKWSEIFGFSNDENFMIIPDIKWLNENKYYDINKIKSFEKYLTAWIRYIPEQIKEICKLKEYNNIKSYQWLNEVYREPNNIYSRINKYREIMDNIKPTQIENPDKIIHFISQINSENIELLVNIIYENLQIMNKDSNKITMLAHPYSDMKTSLFLHIHNIFIDYNLENSLYVNIPTTKDEIFKRRFGASIDIYKYIFDLKIPNYMCISIDERYYV